RWPQRRDRGPLRAEGQARRERSDRGDRGGVEEEGVTPSVGGDARASGRDVARRVVRRDARQGLPPLAIDARPFGAEDRQTADPLRPEGVGVNSQGREPLAGGAPGRTGNEGWAPKAIPARPRSRLLLIPRPSQPGCGRAPPTSTSPSAPTTAATVTS